mmetsp:Transcript_67558/g.213893  ORF Transcript_67558/g.213893 Transcript_67558/m.213893 type:complete len:86 (-) Transcript_67558:126-383(-)
MAPRRSHVVVLVVLIASLQVAKCDVYLNNPRGSNNKLNEVSNNVQNDNRLFDSQNNGAGGYQACAHERQPHAIHTCPLTPQLGDL